MSGGQQYPDLNRSERSATWRREDIETYYEGGKWKNRRQGSSRAFEVGDRKVDLQTCGRKAAIRDGVEHFIKKKDGTIGHRNTYPRSRDPRDIEG